MRPCGIVLAIHFFFVFVSYLDGGVAAGSRDVEVLDEGMVDVSDRQSQVGAGDRKRLETIKMTGDGHKDLEGHGPLQLFFQGCMNGIGVTVSILDGLQGRSILDDRLLRLDAGLDMDHVFIAAQDRDLTLLFMREKTEERNQSQSSFREKSALFGLCSICVRTMNNVLSLRTELLHNVMEGLHPSHKAFLSLLD